MASSVGVLLEYVRNLVVIDEAASALIAARVRERRFGRGEFVLHQGEVNPHQVFVTAGCLKMYQVDDAGQEHILAFSFERWWSGDLYSFYTREPSRFHVRALEPTTTLTITRDALEELYDRVPVLNKMFRLLLERAFIAQQNRIMGHINLSAEERYRELVRTYPFIEQRVAARQIAWYLGITPQFLSTIKRRRRRGRSML